MGRSHPCGRNLLPSLSRDTGGSPGRGKGKDTMKGHSWLTRLGVFALVALMPVLAACGGAAATATAPPPKEVKIGVVLSLTGDNSVYGNPQKNAIQLAIDEINAAGGVPGGKLTPVI